METSRQSLLMLHGALGSRKQFDVLAERIAPSLHPLQIDFEGHGNEAPLTNTFRPERFVEQVVGFLDREHHGPVHVFGYSLGGYVACMLAHRHPARVLSVMMLATKYYWTPDSAERERAMLDPDGMQVKAPRFAEVLRHRHTAIDWRDNMARTSEMLGYFGSYAPLKDEHIASISARVRVAVGDRDNLVSVEESLALSRTLPFGECEVLPQTHHPFEKVDVERLAYSIEDFFLRDGN